MYAKHSLVEQQFVHSFDGDPDAFVGKFQSVWQRLPVQIREKMTELFQEIPVSFHFSNDCFRKVGPGQVKTELGGIEVWFWADAFTWLPATAAEWVIAHELAHVYQKCRGGPFTPDATESERIADELARKWGFSETAIIQIEMLRTNRSLSWKEACYELQTLTTCNR